MLEADVARECVLNGTFSCAFEIDGEGMSELDREYELFEMGEIMEMHSTGSVTLLYMAGRPRLRLVEG